MIKDEVNRKRLVELQKQISAHEKSISRIRKEVADLDGKARNGLDQREMDRNELYVKYFEALAEDEGFAIYMRQ